MQRVSGPAEFTAGCEWICGIARAARGLHRRVLRGSGAHNIQAGDVFMSYCGGHCPWGGICGICGWNGAGGNWAKGPGGWV